MNDQEMYAIESDYDIQNIIRTNRKKLQKNILLFVLFCVVFILSTVAIIIFGTHLMVFIIALSVDILCLFWGLKIFKGNNFSDLNNSYGEIINIHKEVINDRSIVGGYGMYVRRKYDAFTKDATRITLHIEEKNNKIHTHQLKFATEEHLNYYENTDKVIHIWGAHYPVRVMVTNKSWLCPVCGYFNPQEKKVCGKCNCKILK